MKASSLRPALLLSLLGLCSTVLHASTLSDRHPQDAAIASDPAVLVHEDFESGWQRWDYPAANRPRIMIGADEARAHSGDGYLVTRVSRDDLLLRRLLSTEARLTLPRAVDELYWRMYVRFEGDAPQPHHWIRIAATDGEFDIRGKANRRPPGDRAFWNTLDLSHRMTPYFYSYWHGMRSGRCNDGTAVPGCAGDQGETYYYGNRFKSETGGSLRQDAWHCIEARVKANSPGKADTELALWIDDVQQLHYRPGTPVGTWLRATFHPGGCDFDACTEPAPFEGVDFRTDDRVKLRQIFIDAYNQLNTFERRLERIRKKRGQASETQVIYYDDLVVATERIGCMSGPGREP